MPIAVFLPATGTGGYDSGGGRSIDPNGDTDIAVCIQVAGDAKFAENSIPNVATDVATRLVGTIPVGATVTNLSLAVRHKATGGSPGNALGLYAALGVGTAPTGTPPIYDPGDLGSTGILPDGYVAATPLPAIYTDDIFDITAALGINNPVTGLPWTEVDIETYLWGVAAANDFDATTITYTIDYLALLVAYTGGGGDPEDGLTYELDVDEPPIRKFDGFVDKLIAKIPKTNV